MGTEIANVTLDDQVVHDFLEAVYGRKLHPRDAAVAIGVPYGQLLAARATRPALAAAWFLSEEKESGVLEEPKNPLQIKHQWVAKAWKIIGPKFLGMLRRIPDSAEGDDRLMDLLKHKIISETLPRESVTDMSVATIPTDRYAHLTEEQLVAILEKKTANVVDLRDKVRIADRLRDQYTAGKVIDGEFKKCDSGETAGSGRAGAAAGGRRAGEDGVDPQAVGSDEHPSADDRDHGGEPVRR